MKCNLNFSRRSGLRSILLLALLVLSLSTAAIAQAPAYNTLTTIAGIYGNSGYSGDGGPAQYALMWDPTSVAVDPNNGTIYVADTNNAVIRTISNGIINSITPGPTPSPVTVAVDGQSNLYFSSIDGQDIYEYTSTGNLIDLSYVRDNYGNYGLGNMSFSVNSAGYVAAGCGVCDSLLEIYDPTQGIWIEVNPPNLNILVNVGISRLTNSVSIDKDNNIFYYPDSARLFIIPSTSNAPGQIDIPFLDQNPSIARVAGNIYPYAGSFTNSSALCYPAVYCADYNSSASYSSTSGASVYQNAIFNDVSSMAFDSKGNLYVRGYNKANDTEELFEINRATGTIGSVVAQIGDEESSDGSFSASSSHISPGSIAFDANDNLYYVDGGYGLLRELCISPNGTSCPTNQSTY